jgi:hypothetical protein
MPQMDALSFGPAGGMRFSRNSGRSLTSEALGAIRYPSPFFDIAHTYLPSSFKTMLRWCRYYFLTNPLINAVCYKMAEYPVTDLVFDSTNEPLREKWEYLFNRVLSFKKFEIEAGLDYNTYGNTFVSIAFPFHKLLICKRCGHTHRADETKYLFREYKFVGACKKCGSDGEFRVRDHYIRSLRDIRLIRWNPEYITVQHNDATAEDRYYYSIPPQMANDVRMAKRHIIERVPQVFIEALRQNKALLFSRDNIYHLKRPTIAQKDKGWGMPMILPVLKDVFYLQVLRKAQEAIAVEHIVPLRLLFPQTSSSSADVYSTINLTQWRDKIEQELVRWRLDNNYIPLLPIPVGQQTLGGEGRALMLAQEYRVWSEQVIAGLHVPIEFVYGGMQFSGSNVSMRILENHFLDQRTQRMQLITDFILPNIGAFMGWEVVPVHYKAFKMADDLQRSAFNLQLNQAGKLSDRTLLENVDRDYRTEMDQISQEQKFVLENQRSQALAQAAIQGEAQLVGIKYQTRAQKIMLQMSAPPADTKQLADQASQEAGLPGVSSPNAGGQAANAAVAQQNQLGKIPQMDLGGGDKKGNSSTSAQQQVAQDPMAAVQSPLNQGQAGARTDLMMVAQQVASWLNQLPDHDKQREMAQMQRVNPQLYSLVLSMIQVTAGGDKPSNAKPLPEQRAPRRGSEAAVV